MEAAVVVECRADVKTLAAAEVPRPTCSWLVMYYDRSAHGSHGGGVEVKRAVVVFPGRDGRFNVGLAKEVQGEFCLGQQAVPQEVGKDIRDSRQNGEELCLERADGTFSDVAAVNIWRDKLNLSSPFLFDF